MFSRRAADAELPVIAEHYLLLKGQCEQLALNLHGIVCKLTWMTAVIDHLLQQQHHNSKDASKCATAAAIKHTYIYRFDLFICSSFHNQLLLRFIVGGF